MAEGIASREWESSLIWKAATPNGSMQIGQIPNLFATLEVKDKEAAKFHNGEELSREVPFTLSKHTEK